MAKAKKLPSGTWRALVDAGKDAGGKRVYESITAPTEKECNFKALEFELHRKEVNRDSRSMTLEEAMDKYIHSKSNVLSPATVAGYESIKRNYFTALKRMPLSKISKRDVQLQINELAGTLSPKSVRNAYGFISAVIGEFYPALDIAVSLPQRVVYEVTPLTEEQLSALIREISASPSEIPILLAMWLGLRRSEILAIKWSSIDFEQGLLRIDKALVRGPDKAMVEKTTKTVSSTRTLSIPPYILDKLKAMERKGEYVVTCHPNTILPHLQKAAKRAGIQHVRLHDLRHTMASVMLALNVPYKYAMELGGWSSEHTMKKIYQHTFDDRKKAVHRAISQYYEDLVQHEMQTDKK